MYEDSASVKMTPLKTPLRSHRENTATSSPPSMVIPASAMSVIPPADGSIAPTMVSATCIAKTLWKDSDTQLNGSGNSQPVVPGDEGWAGGRMELSTPLNAIAGIDAGFQGRRRDRSEYIDRNIAPEPEMPRNRAMSCDMSYNVIIEEEVDDISPLKKSRAAERKCSFIS